MCFGKSKSPEPTPNTAPPPLKETVAEPAPPPNAKLNTASTPSAAASRTTSSDTGLSIPMG